MRVGIVNRFTERTRRNYPLGLALERAGSSWVPIDVRDVTVTVGAGRGPEVSVGGGRFDQFKVDGVVWRVSEDSFHDFADIQIALTSAVPMVNSWQCNEICSNKWRTTVALTTAGLPVVPSALLPPGARVPTFGGAVTVIKPLVGARGRGVRLAEPGTDPQVAEPYLAQPLITDPGDTQIRALVCGGDTVYVMRRRPRADHTGRDLVVNNIQAGGTPLPARAEPVRDLAVAVAGRVGGDLVGIDLVRWNGTWSVLEVNSSPGLTGIAEVNDDDCYLVAAEAVLAGLRSAGPT